MLQYKLSSGIDSGSESLLSTILTVGIDKSRYSHLSLNSSRYSLLTILIGTSYPS